MKKVKIIVGISLLVQSITFFVLCIVNIEKKKNLAKAFGAFAAAGGVAGAALLISEYKKRKSLKEEDFTDEYFDEIFDEYDDTDMIEEDDIDVSFSLEGEKA